MYQLMVSYDCGASYGLDSYAETVDELRPRMQELDEKTLRWLLEKDGEQDSEMCRIHAGILFGMAALEADDA